MRFKRGIQSPFTPEEKPGRTVTPKSSRRYADWWCCSTIGERNLRFPSENAIGRELSARSTAALYLI
jgi:hypothetical protein